MGRHSRPEGGEGKRAWNGRGRAYPAGVDQTFPPYARLHTGRDYGRVFHRQQKAAGRFLVVLVSPRSKKAGRRGRLGVMVSSKVAKTSVRRHQLKRWLREAFRTRHQERAAGFDVVALVRNDPPPDAHRDLDAEFDRLLPKALAAPARPREGPVAEVPPS